MTDQLPFLDNWKPLSLNEAAAVFAGAPFRWWICGGIALELFAEDAWRSHEDLDVGILRTEADSVYTWLSPTWDLCVGAGGRLTPWRGEALDPGRQENNVWARENLDAPWKLDLTVSSGNDSEWVYRRDESIRQPWNTAVRWTGNGVPYLAPELQLLFKSKNPRPRDDLDAATVTPLLDAHQRGFLKARLPKAHIWHELLEDR